MSLSRKKKEERKARSIPNLLCKKLPVGGATQEIHQRVLD
jgi:hypothetical protein